MNVFRTIIQDIMQRRSKIRFDIQHSLCIPWLFDESYVDHNPPIIYPAPVTDINTDCQKSTNHNGIVTRMLFVYVQGLYTLNGKTFYRQIPWSLEAGRLHVKMIESIWNLTGILAALLPRCLSNFRAIGKFWTRISRLRDFTGFRGETSVRLVNRGPDQNGDIHGDKNVAYTHRMFEAKYGENCEYSQSTH